MKKGRCRLHGGLSTGPKTAEGIEDPQGEDQTRAVLPRRGGTPTTDDEATSGTAGLSAPTQSVRDTAELSAASSSLSQTIGVTLGGNLSGKHEHGR